MAFQVRLKMFADVQDGVRTCMLKFMAVTLISKDKQLI